MLNEVPLPQCRISAMVRFAQHDTETQGNLVDKVLSVYNMPPGAAYGHYQATHTGQIGAPDTAATRDLLAWWHQKATRLAAFVDRPYRQLPQQLCHNDPVPYNVLTVGGHVSAFIDFEFACWVPRGLDIAMALRMTTRSESGSSPIRGPAPGRSARATSA